MKIRREHLTTVALVWAASLIVSTFVYLLVLGPEGKLKRTVDAQLAEKKKQYESAVAAAREQSQSHLKEQIEQLRSRFKDFVVKFEDAANLTFDISQIANEQSIKSFSIKSQEHTTLTEIPDCDHIYENSINVNCTAEFNQFAALLNALERHRPVLFVDKFTVTRPKQNESGAEVTMDLVNLVTKPQGG
jgi:hypothetical protein